MIIFPGGVRQKRNFRRGGGVRFESQFLENPEGRGGHRKNPFRGGGMDIFWNYTMVIVVKLLLLSCLSPSKEHFLLGFFVNNCY